MTALSNDVMLALVNTPLVGVGAQAGMRVLLPFDAPAGGVTVSLTSSNPPVATVSPSNVTIAAGENQAVVTVNGLSVGTTTLTAVAAGYADGTLDISVTNNVLSVPSSLTVPLGGTIGLPVTISSPAPAGGLVVSLVSSNPAAVELVVRHDHDPGWRGGGERDDPGEGARDRHCRGELAELCQRQRPGDDPGKPEHHRFVDSDKAGLPRHGDGRVAERRQSGCRALTRCSGVVHRWRAGLCSDCRGHDSDGSDVGD